MKTLQYEKRPDWANITPAPWLTEPDRAEWIDEETKLPCMIIRNELAGNFCGYVGVPLDSKLAGLDYNEVDVDVHGGLTYGNICSGKICHKAEQEVFWFGFDCAHYMDVQPVKILASILGHGTYRDFEYVKNEVTSLAKQLKELENKND